MSRAFVLLPVRREGLLAHDDEIDVAVLIDVAPGVVLLLGIRLVIHASRSADQPIARFVREIDPLRLCSDGKTAERCSGNRSMHPVHHVLSLSILGFHPTLSRGCAPDVFRPIRASRSPCWFPAASSLAVVSHIPPLAKTAGGPHGPPAIDVPVTGTAPSSR